VTVAEPTIFDLFDGLERAGPGDRTSLDRALAGLPRDAVVLDAGCGRGADLAGLQAHFPDGRVVAVDTATAFVAHVRATHPGVRAEVAGMTEAPGGPFDLVWSAGAVYNVGVGPALTAWRKALKLGGRVAFSDLCQRHDRPASAVRDFFGSEGVTLRGAEALAAEVEVAGYEILDAFWLPQAAWEAYYLPLEARLDTLPDTGIVRAFRAEIALWRKHGGDFGYRMIVARPAP
jgi:SAM-dependent methyltransferase